MSVDKLPMMKRAAKRRLTTPEGGRVRKSRESKSARKRISKASGTTY